MPGSKRSIHAVQEASVETIDNIRREFQKFATNNEAPHQTSYFRQLQGLIREDCIVPFGTNGHPYILADPDMVGHEHKELLKTVQKKCFQESSVQERRIVGIVQPFGSGKTRNALALTEDFIVLPIRFLHTQFPYAQLTASQKELYQNLQQGTKVDLEQVDIFSAKCTRLTHLSFLSVLAFLDMCIKNEIIDPAIYMDRFRLSILMVTPNTYVENWLAGWFNDHRHVAMDEFEFAALEADVFTYDKLQSRQKQVVVVLDEIHALFNACRGYVLHRLNASLPSGEEVIRGWRSEITTGNSNGTACTDLFYQFRDVMIHYLESGRLGFVMCSTVFRILDQLETDCSPLARGCIEQFISLHHFTASEVWTYLTRYFNLSVEKHKTAKIDQLLCKFSRPLYLAELLSSLLASDMTFKLSDESVCNWLVANMQERHTHNVQRASDMLATLTSSSRTRHLVDLLHVLYRLCGGMGLELKKDHVVDLIAKGVARLGRSPKETRVADCAVEEALLAADPCVNAMYDLLLHHSNLHSMLRALDHSAKGHLTERVLALVAITREDSSIATDRRRAGTSLELQLASVPSDIALAEAQCMINIHCYDFVLFPSSLAGPDLWYYDGDSNSIVAVQSKCRKKVCGQAEFRSALKTLNPSEMFSAAEKSAKDYWMEHFHEVGNKSFRRVVFCALGFEKSVHYLVAEYNLVYPKFPIVLMSLQTLNIPLKVRDRLFSELHSNRKPAPVHNPHALQRDWMLKTSPTKNKCIKRDLMDLCAERQIPFSTLKKEQLVEALNTFDVGVAIKDLEITW